MEKINRNINILNIPTTFDGLSITVDSVVVSYVDAQIQLPMGGIDSSVSPYLGIGISAPGYLKIKGAAGQNTFAAIFISALRMQIFKIVGDIGNDIIVEAGDTTTELGRIKANVDFVSLGQ